MPGPTTEVLNEDIKEIKVEIRDIRDDLNTLKADIHTMVGKVAMQENVHEIALSLAELRTEVRINLAIARWAGALFVTTLITFGAAGIWWAGRTTKEVDVLNERLDEMKSANERRDRDVKVLDDHLNRVETSVLKAIEKIGPVAKP